MNSNNLSIFPLLFGLAFSFQNHPPQEQITKPQTNTVSQPSKPNPQPIPTERRITTPFLTPETALHLQIEHELGGQGEALGELKAKVSSLEDKREKIDRPDIDGLKATRQHSEWVVGILGTIIVTSGLVERFRKFLWVALLPYLRRDIFGLGEGTPPPPSKST